MDKLFTLLSLQRQALAAKNIGEWRHIVLNETKKIIPYQHAVFWTHADGKAHVESVSGNATIDTQSAYALDLQKTIAKHIKKSTDDQIVIPVFEGDKKDQESKDIILFFRTEKEGFLGGIVLSRDETFTQAEQEILAELANAYGQALALQNWRSGHRGGGNGTWNAETKSQRKRILIFVAFLIVMAWPVRLSITAPMEITAKDPVIITAPFEGTIEKIVVDAGDIVDANQVVAKMDGIHLQTRLDNIQKERDVAQAALSRLRREALVNPAKRGDLKQLESEIEIKTIELNYATDMLARSQIKTPRTGMAIYADKNALQGKPTGIGERIMVVADPAQKQILIRVPAASMVPLGAEAELSYFLNVAPLSKHEGRIRHVGYQASADANGMLTYKVHADMTQDDHSKDLRIGWKGTAKIYGEKTAFGYALLRRPISVLREFLGV